MKLYKWDVSCGRHGDLSGLFAVDEGDQITLKRLIGTKRKIYLGEVLGKHSEISVVLEEKDFKEIPLDEASIKILVEAVGGTAISGINPLGYDEEEVD